MKIRTLQLLTVFILGFLVFAPASHAKEKAFNYIVAYSMKDQKAFYVPVFTVNIKAVSYNNDQYVADTAMVLQMEDQFTSFLENKMRVRYRDLTVSARAAFKSEEVALKKLEREIDDFRFRGFEIQEVDQFKYDD